MALRFSEIQTFQQQIDDIMTATATVRDDDHMTTTVMASILHDGVEMIIIPRRRKLSHYARTSWQTEAAAIWKQRMWQSVAETTHSDGMRSKETREQALANSNPHASPVAPNSQAVEC